MLGIEHQTDDDQADDTDEGENVASVDAAVWNNARTAITANGRSLSAVALSALEDRGPTAMAEILTAHSERFVPGCRRNLSGGPPPRSCRGARSGFFTPSK